MSRRESARKPISDIGKGSKAERTRTQGRREGRRERGTEAKSLLLREEKRTLCILKEEGERERERERQSNRGCSFECHLLRRCRRHSYDNRGVICAPQVQQGRVFRNVWIGELPFRIKLQRPTSPSRPSRRKISYSENIYNIFSSAFVQDHLMQGSGICKVGHPNLGCCILPSKVEYDTPVY